MVGVGRLSREECAVAVISDGASQATWPRLRVADWTETRDTLHMWAQIVGKIRLAHAPLVNHWWQVTFYVSPCGLTTSAIPYRSGVFDIEFDFLDHQLRIRGSDGAHRSVALEPRPVADFYRETMRALSELGIETKIQASPNEVEPADPLRRGPAAHFLRPEGRAALLAAVAAGQPGAGGVPLVLRRQGEPGALLLGRHGHGLHEVLRTGGAAVSRQRPELR